FIQHQDISYNDVINLNRYKELKLKNNRTSLEDDELNNLTITLRSKLFLPDDLNKLQDCITNLETFFKNETEGYILQKQTEFDAEIQKFSYKGQYSSVVNYQMWNVITYNYETYISKQNNNINHVPTDTNWWFKAASRGAQGVPGMNLTYLSEYNNAYSYQIGQAVSYQGTIYYCISPSIGNIPYEGSQYWTIFMKGLTPIIQDTPPDNPMLGTIWIQTGI
ncbi:MAG TPA: hypothetical protein GX708_02985, partial [Gallicola sp.]|nr:hypothetical protein [Gallicola sp.]